MIYCDQVAHVMDVTSVPSRRLGREEVAKLFIHFAAEESKKLSGSVLSAVHDSEDEDSNYCSSSSWVVDDDEGEDSQFDWEWHE